MKNKYCELDYIYCRFNGRLQFTILESFRPVSVSHHQHKHKNLVQKERYLKCCVMKIVPKIFNDICFATTFKLIWSFLCSPIKL